MTDKAANNRRIAKNTAVLYGRMLVTMGISLYISRVVLRLLGVEDFGIYNVVGGIVSMFSIISASMTSAISRFITFELGRGDEKRLKEVFATAVSIQIGLAIAVGLVAEVAGVWFLNTYMNIPAERMGAANWVLQCSILTFMVKIVSMPYNAAIIAHERMNAFAYISIVEVVLKLGVALSLEAMTGDRLKAFAVLILCVAAVVRIIYGIYCKRRFAECSFRFSYNRAITRQMAGFAGWNFVGSSAAILRDQGGNVLLNLFCGPAVNAARGISLQVNNAVRLFSDNFMMALRPQIIKSYATGEGDYMMTLVVQGARLCFYLLLLPAVPILVNTEYLLGLWLETYPEHTAAFVRLVVVFMLSESISLPLQTAMQATGKIRDYQLVVGGLQLLNLPIAWALLHGGLAPEAVLWTAVGMSQCCLGARLFMLRRMIALPVGRYMRQVYARVVAVAAVTAAMVRVCTPGGDTSIGGFAMTTVGAVMITLAVEIVIGCGKAERTLIWNKLRRRRRQG